MCKCTLFPQLVYCHICFWGAIVLSLRCTNFTPPPIFLPVLFWKREVLAHCKINQWPEFSPGCFSVSGRYSLLTNSLLADTPSQVVQLLSITLHAQNCPLWTLNFVIMTTCGLGRSTARTASPARTWPTSIAADVPPRNMLVLIDYTSYMYVHIAVIVMRVFSGDGESQLEVDRGGSTIKRRWMEVTEEGAGSFVCSAISTIGVQKIHGGKSRLDQYIYVPCRLSTHQAIY